MDTVPVVLKIKTSFIDYEVSKLILILPLFCYPRNAVGYINKGLTITE